MAYLRVGQLAGIKALALGNPCYTNRSFASQLRISAKYFITKWRRSWRVATLALIIHVERVWRAHS